MKLLYLFCLTISLSFTDLGSYIVLQKVSKKQFETKIDESIIYGAFKERRNSKAGWLDIQIVLLTDKENGEIYGLRTKRKFQSKKNKIFCFNIPKGNYIIEYYGWEIPTWYGSKTQKEHIIKYKDSTAKEFKEKLRSGKIKIDEQKRYEITINKNEIYYVGTWDFSEEIPLFINDKKECLNKMKIKYKNLDLGKAKVAIPK